VTEFLVYLALVAVLIVAGVGVGILVARRLGPWVERDEEPDDD